MRGEIKQGRVDDYSTKHPKDHGKKTFLFHDNVHKNKNIRNNLLSRDEYTGEVGGGRVTGRGSKIFEN